MQSNNFYGTGNNVTASRQKIGWADVLEAGTDVVTSIFGNDGGGGGSSSGGSGGSGGNDNGQPFGRFPIYGRQRPAGQQQTGNQSSAISQLILPISIFVFGIVISVILYKKL